MNRRTFVLSVGSIAATGGAALGSGAFDLVEADRTASITVTDDSSAVIGLSANSSEFVSTDGNNLLQLNYSGSANSSGANDNAVTTVEAGFTISNNDDTQGVGVKVGHDAGDTAAVNFFGDTGKTTGIESYPGANGDPHNLDAYNSTDGADTVDVTFELDTTVTDLSGLSTITISADPSQYTA
jgi:hypothetical protein